MNFAVIAAGLGSRLRREGLDCPKPLLPLGGTPMIIRLTDIFARSGAESVSVIIRRDADTVADALYSAARRYDFPLQVLRGDSAGSMLSLAALLPAIPRGPFILTTVDTIFRPDEFTDYVAAFSRTADSASRALFGVTGLIDDEKPLYVDLIPGTMTVRAFMDTPPLRPRYISAGIYGLHTDSAARAIELCRRRNLVRMRDFQRALLELGTTVTAFPFTDAVDLDHLSDIPADL